jgi:hypothetical protein
MAGEDSRQGFVAVAVARLGAVLIYRLVLLYQHECNLFLGKGIKPLLRAA